MNRLFRVVAWIGFLLTGLALAIPLAAGSVPSALGPVTQLAVGGALLIGVGGLLAELVVFIYYGRLVTTAAAGIIGVAAVGLVDIVAGAPAVALELLVALGIASVSLYRSWRGGVRSRRLGTKVLLGFAGGSVVTVLAFAIISIVANAPQAYGDVMVDDQSAGFARAGSASWYESSGGYNNHFWWKYTSQSGVVDRAMWTPNLPASGNWQVFVFVPSVNATTTNARYRIDHNGSQTTVSVNQNNYYNAWVSLGTYYFPSGGGVNGEVFLGDETLEGSAHQIAFDAVKWVWVGP